MTAYLEKKILLISYHFPPSTAVGGLRVAYFAKHLHLLGWDVYVLTIDNRYLNELDPERNNDIESVKIFKTCKLPSIRQFYLGLKGFYYSILRKKQFIGDDLGVFDASGKSEAPLKENIFQRVKRYLNSLIIAFPDFEREWIPVAVFKAVLEIKRRRIGYVLTSSPPHSVQITGLFVKKLTGVKWLADFRDPWVTAGWKIPFLSCALSNWFSQKIEEKVVRHADIVLANTPNLCRAFRESYCNFSETSFRYLPNGFDSEIFNAIENLKKNERFTIAYTGTLYFGRSPEPVFKALRELLDEGKIQGQNVNVELVGNCKYMGGCPIEKVIQSYGLNDIVEVLPPVSYVKALEIIKRSHVALLLAPSQPFQIPAKVYDYIGTRTRILALTEEGATADLINSTKTGTVLSPSDIEGIKDFICQYETLPEARNQEMDLDILQQYERRNIAKELSRYLEQI